MTRMLTLALALAETIRQSGPDGAPSGACFAALMTHGITHEEYIRLLAGVKGAGLVRERNHRLTWIGPHLAEKGHTT